MAAWWHMPHWAHYGGLLDLVWQSHSAKYGVSFLSSPHQEIEETLIFPVDDDKLSAECLIIILD
jgi:hypothetical protein